MSSSLSNGKNMDNNFTTKEEDGIHKTQKYKEIIDKLPKEKMGASSWYLHEYQGFWYTPSFLEKIFSLQENFEADPSDILVCSSPKTGTTWLKALSFAIVTRKRFDESSNPLLKAVSHECIPFMEFDLITGSSSTRDPQLPLMASHLPYIALPESVITENCRIVYICRDPKDMLVSMWHFRKKLSLKDVQMTSFDEKFVEYFCGGRTFYGPYWDHVLGYWKASQERPENVLFLKYEDMKEDTLLHIKKMADFFDQPFSKEEEIQGVPEKLMNMCSFENLSNLEVNKSGKHRGGTPLAMDNNIYFRKGQVGDWKNHFTQEMKEQIDQIMDEKLYGSGLTFSRPRDNKKNNN